MAVLKNDAPKRRRSIAAPTQNQKSLVAPVSKRRAHSIVPGERLSILAKARRSLVPRKSILKASSIINTEEQTQQSSQSSNSQSSLPDDSNVTESMDLTLEYRARIHDNASRKSLGRRVSFAEHAQVRLFQTPNHDNTNSTGSPQSSPIPSSPEADVLPTLSNENDYPRGQRRSSVRYSMAGSEDMDMSSDNLGAFLDSGEGSALMGEELDLDGNDNMDATEALRGNLPRRRSLSGRQPFAPIRPRDSIMFPEDGTIPFDNDDDDDDDGNSAQSMLEEDSQVQSEAENSQEGMEFTVPMGQSLKPPATEDPVWLALRQVTHSGDTPHEPEASSEDDIQVAGSQQGMELNDAMARLMRARDSLGEHTEDIIEDMEITSVNGNFAARDDSSSSSDDTPNDDFGNGDETLNISKIVGRLSLGRMSLGFQDTTMDESGIYESTIPLSSSTPQQSLAQPPPEKDRLTPDLPSDLPDFPETPEPERVEAPRPSVFLPPTEETNVPPPLPPITPLTTPAIATEQPPKSPVFKLIPPPPASDSAVLQLPKPHARHISPAKPKPKPSFSAAFAPPVAKPSPKKLSSAQSTPVNGTTNKRRFSVMQDGAPDTGRSSPAKRPTLGPKSIAGPSPNQRSAPSPGKNTPRKGSHAPSAAPKRQSGYFARRKSLGNALIVPTDGRGESHISTPSSLRENAGRARASLGSTLPEDWTRLDRNDLALTLPTIVPPTGKSQQEEARQEPVPLPISGPIDPPIPVSVASPEPAIIPHGRTPPVTGDREDENNVREASINVGEQPLQTSPAEDIPSISIDQFFSMTGIKFMDDLTTPRRSVYPHTGSRKSRNPTDIPLSEYYPTMGIDVPQLGLFTKVSKDLEGWMARSKADFAQAEEEAAKVTPELFVEYMRADEEGQAELLHQLNFIRTNARGQAKSDWYDWKLKWIEGLQDTAEQTFTDLQSDAKSLEPIMNSGEELVFALEKECDELLQLLEHEQEEVAEIEASDQNYLNDLKDSIAEQNFEVEALRAELSEQTEQLNYLRGRLQEIAISKQEEANAYAKAQHFLEMKENSTRTEVFRLRGELEALENFHQFRVTRVDESLFEYVHASRYKVSIPCNNYLPITSNAEISHVVDAKAIKDDFPQYSSIVLQAAKALVHRLYPKSCKMILQMLSEYWSCCSQLRAQLRLVSIKYPIEFLPMDLDGMPGFKVKVKVIIPSKKAKVFVIFNFTCDIFSKWPMSVSHLTSDVTVAYGPVEQSTLAEAMHVSRPRRYTINEVNVLFMRKALIP
ncbi:hypothetical protein Agabi119p4_854 [Agaricus bisporus var. burnettii]|uniref:Spc7 kinetochore protein domain-containing protein n=1 Tax=Agaricus bisporus var. burnettii TaxID=192524 RepID=A0A8H7KLJ4_AGABI|nr:hypothetical protein Agabi119p4_854 [Agaricus bisporus var. burnettii]